MLLFLPSSWEGSVSPATLDLGDGIWARSGLGPPALRNDLPGSCEAGKLAVFTIIQGRSGWGWKWAECRVWTSRGSDEDSSIHFYIQRAHESGGENKLGPGRSLLRIFIWFSWQRIPAQVLFSSRFLWGLLHCQEPEAASEAGQGVLRLFLESWGKGLAAIPEPGQINQSGCSDGCWMGGVS